MLPEQDRLIESLHKAYFTKLLLYAQAILGNSTAAQDVVQDTFHEAVLKVDTLMTHENPGGWLMLTCKNKIREYMRFRRRYLYRFLSLDTDYVPVPCRSDRPDQESDEMDGPPLIDRIKARLAEEEFLLLKRFALDGASHLEIAKELNITVYASQKRLERIRKKLYEEFPDRKKKK